MIIQSEHNIMDTVLIVCDCSDPGHHLIVSKEPEDDEYYFTITLHNVPGFWKRLKIAFRYLFGKITLTHMMQQFDGIAVSKKQMEQFSHKLNQWLV